MVNKLLCFFLIFSGLLSQAQDLFKRTYGAEGTFNQGFGLCNSNDQGFMICGATGGFGAVNGGGLVIKTDSVGIQIWAKAFGGGLNDVLKSIIKTNDNNYVAVGFSNSNSDLTIKGWVIKIDNQGNVIWQKQLGTGEWNYFESVRNSADGGLVMAGTTLMSDGSSGWVVKLDLNGDQVWEKLLNINGKESFNDLAAFANGDLILGGATESIGNGLKDAFVVRLNSNGDIIYTKTIGFEGEDVCLGIDTAMNNSFAITGYFTQNDTKKFLIQWLDSDGLTLSDNISGSGPVIGKKIIHRGNNEFVIASDYKPFNAWHALGWITYSQLYVRCNKDFYGNKDSYSFAGALGKNNSFVVVGTTDAFTPGQSSIFMFNMTDSCQDSPTVVVNLATVSDVKIGIYPNPSSQYFNIESVLKPDLIEVYNASGQLVYVEKPIENTSTIPVSQWPDGLFLVKIKLSNQVNFQKVIVQH